MFNISRKLSIVVFVCCWIPLWVGCDDSRDRVRPRVTGRGSLPAPTGVTATVDPATLQVRVEWSVVTNATSYILYRSQEGTDYKVVTTTTDRSFVDENTNSGNTLSYEVTATTHVAISYPSTAVTVHVSFGPPHSAISPLAVWTGSEMLIWGGDIGVSICNNTGAKYNPVTNSWLPMSSVNAPTSGCWVASPYMTATWASTEMLLWGGYSPGYRYSPVLDAWKNISYVNGPSLRQAHSAVWTGTELIIWGGFRQSVTTSAWKVTNTGGRYSPASDLWYPTSISNAPSARSNQYAFWTGSKMIVWGYGPGELYDPVPDIWAPIPNTNAKMGSAIWTGKEMIVWGGSSQLPSGDIVYSNEGGRYNPASNVWTATSLVNAPSPRDGHVAVWSFDKMIVWGGHTSTGSGEFRSDIGHQDGARYDPNTDTWTPITSINAPSARIGEIAVSTGKEMIIWGGAGSDSYLSTGGRYNPETDTWTPTFAGYK